MQKEFLPARPTIGRCLLLVLFISGIYALDNISISKYVPYTIYSNIIKPLLWISIALFVRFLPKARYKSTIRMKSNILWWGIIFAITYLAVQICAGALFGFGRSPYSRSVTGILINIFSLGSMLVGRESARFYIISTVAKKENLISILLVSLFITLPGYPVSKFTGLASARQIVEFAAQQLLPDFCSNLFASYLTLIGGILPSLSYMGILQGFHWLSPILPNLNWITTALIGIMCPVFFLAIMQNVFLKETRKISRSDKKENTFGWIVTCLASISIVWFSVGVFPIYPSVIATGSMEPLIKPGDVILVEKIRKEEEIGKLKEGDIIQFKMENFLVSHRIIDIVEGQNGKSFRTKGDNNNSPDAEAVLPENIKGRIVQIVPKIGWPSLLIKQRNDVPLDKVEF